MTNCQLRVLVSILLAFSLFASVWVAVVSSGSGIDDMQDVAKLMGELFDDNQTCTTPVIELGFLVPGSYNEPLKENERTFRKVLGFVRKTARQMKISDSGTHVGLVLYGKKPYMAFDFNEYFDMPGLSQAIEEVKTTEHGHNVGKALTFAKEQLYDKSARHGISKALVVLQSKNSEDMIDHGAETLKKAGVKIYKVHIGAEGDSMEMSDMASEVQNTFSADQDHLQDLVTRLVLKLCEDSKEKSSAETLKELNLASDEPDSKMNPEEEPSPSKNTVSISGVTSSSQPTGMGNEDLQSTLKHLNSSQLESPIEHSASGQNDSFEDAVANDSETSSLHVDKLDMQSLTKARANETTPAVDDQATGTADGDDSATSHELMPKQHSSDTEKTENSETATPKNSTPTASNKHVIQLRNLANKICSAKADIGILIDGSSTVRQERFSRLLSFAKSLVRSFSISKDHAHIAVATASKGPQMSFDFQGFNDESSITTAISRTTYQGGPFLLGSSLTGLKTSWFKNSGRKSYPQLLLVLATTSSIDYIKAPARALRDRGVRIESVGIGTGFDGVQLKEIATHPAQDHVMAISKYELLPMIRPLLTVRMCRAVGGKLIPRPVAEIHDRDRTVMPTSSTSTKQANHDNNKAQKPHTSVRMKQDGTEDKQTHQVKQMHQYEIKEHLKQQMDQLNQIQEKDKGHQGNSLLDQSEVDKKKLKEDIRRKLYALLRRLGGTKRDVKAAYRSIIYNINGHHNSNNCKDKHDLCKQWAKDNLCDIGNEIMDSQSVQRVCPKSCSVCLK